MWVRVQVTAFFLLFFSSLLLQCDFNINSMPYLVSSTFVTLYDAQASSAYSALIKDNLTVACILYFML